METKKIDPNQTKYINDENMQNDLFMFFSNFGLDPKDVSCSLDENKFSKLRFCCDKFDAHINSDYLFNFVFFDNTDTRHHENIRIVDLDYNCSFYGIDKKTYLTCALVELFSKRFPSYKNEWKHLLKTQQLPVFNSQKIDKPLPLFKDESNISDLITEVHQTKIDRINNNNPKIKK